MALALFSSSSCRWFAAGPPVVNYTHDVRNTLRHPLILDGCSPSLDCSRRRRTSACTFYPVFKEPVLLGRSPTDFPVVRRTFQSYQPRLTLSTPHFDSAKIFSTPWPVVPGRQGRPLRRSIIQRRPSVRREPRWRAEWHALEAAGSSELEGIASAGRISLPNNRVTLG
jgi:hypothetical protein